MVEQEDPLFGSGRDEHVVGRHALVEVGDRLA